MPTLQLLCANDDAGPVGQLRLDLERRGWSVFLTLFGSAAVVQSHSDGSAVIGWLPKDARLLPEVMEQLWQLGAEASHVVLLVPGQISDMPSSHVPGNASLLAIDAFDYDRTFDDVFRALLAPWPTWLDARVRPSHLSRPTGVAWWTEDLVVVDERFEHVVRLGPDSSTVLIPGLSEPHHVAADRRQLLVANKGADNIVIARVVDDMATDVMRLDEAEGALAHPHAARQSEYHTAVVDTDHHRVLVGPGQLHSSTDIPWISIGGLHGPCDASLSQGMVLVADTFAHRIVGYDLTGRELGTTGRYGADLGEFAYPVGIATWKDYMFVSDEENKRLQVFRLLPKAGSLDFMVLGVLGAPFVRSPFGLSVNRENRLAVSDRDRRCVWLIDLERALAELGS